jgi:hypothetical protein
MDSNDQRTVIQYESRRTDNQMWDVTDAGGGHFYIRNARNGNALAVQNDRNSQPLVAEPYTGSANQQWRIESGEDSTAILVNRNGKSIDIPYGSTDNGVKINSYSRNNEVNQRWQFREVAGSGVNSGVNSGRYDRRDQVKDRYDRNSRNRRDTTGRGGSSRYDSAPVGNVRPDANGMYFDDRDQMYKLDGDGVCVYRDRDFRGDAMCARVRDGRAQLGTDFRNIGSIRFFGNARGAQLFDRENFRGNSVEVTRDENDLSRSTNQNLRTTPRSIRVY